MTECNPTQLEFHALGRQEVVGRFDGGMHHLRRWCGLLLREVDYRLGLLSSHGHLLHRLPQSQQR
jgi:hypothetical protein